MAGGGGWPYKILAVIQFYPLVPNEQQSLLPFFPLLKLRRRRVVSVDGSY